MKKIPIDKNFYSSSVIFTVFLFVSVYLVIWIRCTFNLGWETQIMDAVYLDFLGLSFLIAVVAISVLGRRQLWAYYMILIIFSVFGTVTIDLLLHGTWFSINGYWGDQAFRTSILLKFMKISLTKDFYFYDLPQFYPPAYFLLLSLIGKLLSLEAFQLLKKGTILIYFFTPMALYWCWRSLVSHSQAFWITLSTVVLLSVPYNFPLSNPHEFLCNTFFICWVFYYLPIKSKAIPSIKSIVVGSVLGAILFTVYPYPFFMLPFYVILQVMYRLWFGNGLRTTIKEFLRSILLGFNVLLLSAPYWFPVTLSLLYYGNKPADQEWFHIQRTGLQTVFEGDSWTILLVFGGLLVTLKRVSGKFAHQLLIYLLAALLFVLLGFFLNIINHPINILKAKTALIVVSAVMMGYGLSLFERSRKKYIRVFGYVVSIATLLFFVRDFHGYISHPQIVLARETGVPNWNIDERLEEELLGTTILTGEEKLSSFYPVYYFIANNQHYAHPASQFGDRFQFLQLLEKVDNPKLMNMALRYNNFHAIDFVCLIEGKEDLKMPISLSNYPNKFISRWLNFNPQTFSDTLFFYPTNRNPWVKVRTIPLEFDNIDISQSFSSSSVSSVFLSVYRTLKLSTYIADSIATEIKATIPDSLIAGLVAQEWLIGHRYDRFATLQDILFFETGDSLYSLFAFTVENEINRDFKLFLHTYSDDTSEMRNFEFSPDRSTSKWQKGDLVICSLSIPKPERTLKFSIGFFRGSNRISKAYNSQLSILK